MDLLDVLCSVCATVPETEPTNRNPHTAPCQDHGKLNDRLDSVEKVIHILRIISSVFIAYYN